MYRSQYLCNPTIYMMPMYHLNTKWWKHIGITTQLADRRSSIVKIVCCNYLYEYILISYLKIFSCLSLFGTVAVVHLKKRLNFGMDKHNLDFMMSGCIFDRCVCVCVCVSYSKASKFVSYNFC